VRSSQRSNPNPETQKGIRRSKGRRWEWIGAPKSAVKFTVTAHRQSAFCRWNSAEAKRK